MTPLTNAELEALEKEHADAERNGFCFVCPETEPGSCMGHSVPCPTVRLISEVRRLREALDHVIYAGNPPRDATGADVCRWLSDIARAALTREDR